MNIVLIEDEPAKLKYEFCHCGCSREHASAFSCWSLAHALFGLLAGVGLQAWHPSSRSGESEWCRIGLLAFVAVLWELIERVCYSRYAAFENMCVGTSYLGDHWSNSVADIFSTFLGYSVAVIINQVEIAE